VAGVVTGPVPGPVTSRLRPGDDDAGAVALDPAFVLPRRVAMWAGTDGDRPFLEELTGRRSSYGETWAAVRRWATWLDDLGVRRGDRVVSLLPASIDAVLLWLAAGSIGALEVPVDPALRGAFLRHVLTDSGARVCLVRPEHADLIAGSGVPGLEIVAVPREGSPADDARPVKRLTFPAPEDPSCVIYTSGTTGLPKGVVISWAQMAASIGRIPRSWLSETDAVYDCHPMFHVTGRTPLLSMSDVGGRVVLRERFSASAFLDDVRAGRCTTTTAHTALILATPERDDDRDNPLRVVFGAHNLRLSQRFARRFGVHVLEAYGSTELGFPLVQRTPVPDLEHRWCGSPRPGYGTRVVAEDGTDVPDGTAGELWVRPPSRPLMLLEYLNQPEATAAATADGWYRTGDAVIRHPDGLFEFVDRMRDTIRRHGENISSAAIEAVVAADPAVAECAVVGVPDPVAGQAVAVALVPAPGGCDPGDLWQRLTEQLPRHALPGYVVVLDELPRTPTNKVRKAELREHLDLTAAWQPGAGRPVAPSGRRLSSP
jgi:crotonobetaine/carnitine-CoA ligase